MTKLTIKDYITIALFLFTIGGFVYKYAELASTVEAHEKQLEAVNLEVLKLQMENNKTTLEKIETKVDKMYDVVIKLQD